MIAIVEKFLKPPGTPPDGREEDVESLQIKPLSDEIERALLAAFTDSPEAAAAWEKAAPVALGSWARGELTPKSDLDLLFTGDESAAADVTRRAQEAGLKIRSRIPESRDDWTKGVETFDVLAMLMGKPLTEGADRAFAKQMELVKPRLKDLRREFFQVLKKERATRAERFDSIANYLEPNLKFGPGGLRDLAQAYQLRLLFPEKFESSERAHALHVFDYYRRLFVMSRIRVQMSEGGGDLLSAYEQTDVSKWFGYESTRDFMREVQKGLSRVSFYADVDFEHARVSAAEIGRFASRETTFVDLAGWLEKEPTVLVQAKARDIGFRLYRSAVREGGRAKDRANEVLRRILTKSVDPLEGDALTIALFRSRWIDLAVTDFKKIVGYVQHDQYHRYTVDAHLLQAIREMKRVAARPSILGRLGKIAKSLTKEDWKILGWSALYHDVGKGSGGDHSDKSVVIAREDLAKWGLGREATEEIIWLIENHLELSLAAFRGNPAHPSTWRMLHAKGIEGKRLLRLAIFTAVDIRATNREAYTSWKERLLAELVDSLEKPEARSLAALQKALEAKKETKLLPLLDRLDPFLVSSLPPRTLADDLMRVNEAISRPGLAGRGSEITVRVAKIAKSKRIWIRFHVAEDRPGLFARMARALQAAGLSVRHASILSDEMVGVYDWFEVKPPHSTQGLEAKLTKLLVATAKESASVSVSSEIFDEIECLATGDDEWILSFRGKDVRGALLSAADALSSEGVSISWAKVHTWGRQIDDIFGIVLPTKGAMKEESSRYLETLLEGLREKVGKKK